MKTSFKMLLGVVILSTTSLSAQTYTSSNYANVGDTVYLTSATLANLNFDTTGVGITWDYSMLVGNSQTTLAFLSASQTGYTNFTFPYIFTSNVNLASTTGQSIAIGPVYATDVYSYFKKTTSVLQQSASAYRLNSVPIKATYISPGPDILCVFPLAYNNIDSSTSGYVANVSNIFYKSTQIHRVNHVEGTGTVITPYGTFTNALKLVSYVTETDSLAIDTFSTPEYTVQYREIKFFDPSKKYEVLYVKQTWVNSVYVTSEIKYFDNKIYFQPTSLFAYYPGCPVIGDTIHFQNLSTNASAYNWNFDDPASGPNNTSTLQNPIHIYANAGTYNVQLITMNGNLSDTISIPIVINANLNAPTITIAASQNPVCMGDSITFTSSITNGGSYPVYQWYANGTIIIGANGATYTRAALVNGDSITCQLVSSSLCFASSTALSDTVVMAVNNLPVPVITANGNVLATGTYSAYQWLLNGVPINGATAQTYTAQTNGNYTVWVADILGCSDTSAVYSLISMGMATTAATPVFTMYPNPASASVQVTSDVMMNEILLMNVVGDVIYAKRNVSSKTERLDVRDLPAGIYFIQMNSDKRAVTQKLIVTH